VHPEVLAGSSSEPSGPVGSTSSVPIQDLRAKVAASEAQIERLKQLLESTLQVDSEDDTSTSCSTSSSGESESEDDKAPSKGKAKVGGKAVNGKGKKTKRDDDTHYFDSYAQNGPPMSHFDTHESQAYPFPTFQRSTKLC
jgi:hypothetical protein